MESKIPYESVMPHLNSLRAAGYYQLDEKLSKFRRLFQTVYMNLILSLISLFTVQQIAKVYQVMDDPNKVIDTMFLLLTNSDSIYKQVIFWKKHDQIKELLNILQGPLFNQNEPEHRILLLRTSRQARVLLRGFNIAALSTCLLWVLYPMILYAQSKPVEFAIWLPFDPNRSPQFYIAIFYVWVQTSWLAFGNTSMDACIAYFFAQCKTQLTILRWDLENIVRKCKEESLKSSQPFVIIFHSRFEKIIQLHREIVKLSNNTQDIFGGAILYFFLISAWIICTTAYRIISIDPASVAFLSMIMYMMCILIEIYLYCYFGNEVAHESDKLLQSAFAMDWYKIPQKYRCSLLVFMERIKRRIEPTAGVLIPLSNSTFVSILRSSYTFYAFLKNTE